MIEVIGIPGSHEYDVACKFRDAFAAQWPGIATSPASEEIIRIAANAKLSGYQVSDIDIVIGAVFNRQRHFVVRKLIKDKDGNAITGVKARVQNFFCAVEVKGQDGDGVAFQGDEINVRYKGNWKSATDQNVKQVHALKAYFEHQHLDLFIYRCVVLDGLGELPLAGITTQPEAGAVASVFTAGEFLASIAGVYGLNKWNSEYSVSSCKQEVARKAMDAPIFQQVQPTRIDRQRMDRIVTAMPEAKAFAALLGKQRVHIRGHGGTGKTVLMLQSAHLAYQDHGRRCLVLTYNIALAGDIRRLLALLGVPSAIEGGGVEVKTAMSFIYTWLSRLGVKSDQTGFGDYEKLCAECLEMIDQGAITSADIEQKIEEDPELLGFDAIIVDEAQDWPQPEARLLSAIYGGHKVSIADGREQLLRGKPTDWSRTLSDEHQSQDHSFTRCLRMKRNLGLFANAVASIASLNWEIEPNDQAAGGKVILRRGSYGDHPELVHQVVAEAAAAGNEPVDLLHCVPPAAVLATSAGRSSRLSEELKKMGYATWDGVDDKVRADFPRSPDLFRILQYDSVRGLEGWTTVLDHFDEAWAYKANYWLSHFNSDPEGPPDSQRAASTAAARWSMIPLTRPVDTLVVTWTDDNSPIAKILIEAAKRHPDFVDFS